MNLASMTQCIQGGAEVVTGCSTGLLQAGAVSRKPPSERLIDLFIKSVYTCPAFGEGGKWCFGLENDWMFCFVCFSRVRRPFLMVYFFSFFFLLVQVSASAVV